MGPRCPFASPPDAPDPPPGPTPTPDLVALPGREGQKAAALLAEAMRHGREALAGALAPALRRALAAGPDLPAHLFSDAELHRLTEAIAGANAAADLLGRARVRELVYRNSDGPRKFAEFRQFADAPIPPLSPEAALEYFRALVPTLAVDVNGWPREQRRRAFTVAEATELSLVEQIQGAIADYLEQGGTPEGLDGPEMVQSLMDGAGVTTANPARAEMVFRTAAADALTQGAWSEYEQVSEDFPVWIYDAVTDNRARPHHAARDGLYYSSATSFDVVRGTDIGDVANCRCSFRPVHKSEWEQLKASGTELSG